MERNGVNMNKGKFYAHMTQEVYPKIGIRPVIDGRPLVREPLEEQTMQMARSVARLFTEHLKYPNGKPVECVIADSCIGGVAEAAQTAEKFAREGVGLSVTVSPCWCYGAETMDMDPYIPKAIWGFNGTERPGAVYLALLWQPMTRKGFRLSAYMAGTFKIAAIQRYQPMSGKTAQIARLDLRWRKCGPLLPCHRRGLHGHSWLYNRSRFLEDYLGLRYEMVDMSEFVPD